MGTATNQIKPKVRDPRWLRVDVCRDHAKGKCRRRGSECRFAHTLPSCIIENNKAVVCYDSMRNRCSREHCKFYHPPYHIREYLLAFGKALEQERLEQERRIDSNEELTCTAAEQRRWSVSSGNSSVYTNQSYTRDTDCQVNIGQLVPSERIIYDQTQQDFVTAAGAQGLSYMQRDCLQTAYNTPNNLNPGHILVSNSQASTLQFITQDFATFKPPIYRSINGGVVYQMIPAPFLAPTAMHGGAVQMPVYMPPQALPPLPYPGYANQGIVAHFDPCSSSWT